MNLSNRLFAGSIALLALLPSCGAQVDFASTGSDSPNGNPSATTGGTSSANTSPLNGGAVSAGGATGVDPYYCDGLLLNRNCGTFHRDTDSVPIGCDIALKESPPDPSRSILAIDCVAQPLANRNLPDAGATEGFLIDYSQNPAHLILIGPSCEMFQSPGYHVLDFIQGCQVGC